MTRGAAVAGGGEPRGGAAAAGGERTTASERRRAPAAVTTYFADYAWLGGDAVTADVAIDVADGRIVAVRPGAERAGTHLRGVTLPGLANAHSHAFQRALRGRTQRGGGSFWTWREDMYALARDDDAGPLLRARARAPTRRCSRPASRPSASSTTCTSPTR